MDPRPSLKTILELTLELPRAYHANKQIIGFHSLLWACSGQPRAYLVNEQNIGIHCFGPTRAYLKGDCIRIYIAYETAYYT